MSGFRVKDFSIFCDGRKFNIIIKTAKIGREIVLGRFIRKGGNVHLLVKVGVKRTLRPRYKSYGPDTKVFSLS